MAISLADPGGPIEAVKETSATLKTVLRAADDGGRGELVDAVARDAAAAARARKNPLSDFKPGKGAGAGVEILEELGEVTAFVGGLGTGGTLMGNGRRLKEHDPETKIVAAEPMQGELVQGLRSLDDGFIPPIIDLSLLDRKIMVSNRDAIVWTQKLLREEGMFAGVSSGAIAYVAHRIASELDGGNVVFLVPDDGWKYLSSGVYTKSVDELEDIDSTVWW
jgi:cysteine synthase B